MKLKETGCEGVQYIHLAQDRDKCLAVMDTAQNPWVP